MVKQKVNALLDKYEDPREALDYSYTKQLEMLNGGPQLIPINSNILAVGTGQITEQRQQEFAEQYTSTGQHAPYIPVDPYYRPSRLVNFYTDTNEEPVGVSLLGKVSLDELVEIAKSLH